MMSMKDKNLKRFGIWFLVFQVTLISFVSEALLNVNASNMTSSPIIELSSSNTDWTNENVIINSNIEGSYVQEQSKTVTGQSSANYDDGEFKGPLEKYQTGGSYIPGESKEITGHTFPNYNSEGFTGTLSQYVYSGSYIPEKYENVSVEVHFAFQNELDEKATHYYNQNGFTGTLQKTGSRYNQLLQKGVGFNILTTQPNLDSTPVTDYNYLFTPQRIIEILGQNFTNPYVTNLIWSGPMVAQEQILNGVTYYYTRPLTADLNYTGHVGIYSGQVYKPASDTRVYRYKGTVTKPPVDTRTYSYKGIVKKSAYNNEIVSKKWAKGNQNANYFTSNGNNISGNSFITTENGTYTVYAKDSSNKEITKTIEVKIDKTKPILNISTSNIDRKPHEDVVVNIIASDDLSGIKSITLPNGTVKTESSFQYTMTKNGQHKFIVEDNAGNTHTEIYELSSIERILDFKGPEIESGFEIKIQPNMKKDLHVGNINIRDWRENSNNGWKLYVESSRLQSNAHILPSGIISLDGIQNVNKLDGDKNGLLSYNDINTIIDDGKVEIINASNERGSYVVSFKENALKFNFPTSQIRKAAYNTKMTWTLQSSPQID